MKILNVAEKPSVARSISAVLSTNSRVVPGRHKYCPNIFFKCENEMIFTSVLGHLFSWDFKAKTGWTGVDPYDLFDAEIEKSLSSDMESVGRNICSLSKQCEMVVIWTDCDREGENIASQIKQLVGNKTVKRARFSAISRTEVEKAMKSLVDINERESIAVDARIELDLRIGSAFTRFQTLAYGSVTESSKKQILSFGPCQIPTLNFVVQRHHLIEAFKPEKFYSLEYKIIEKDKRTVKNGCNNSLSTFKWKRGSIFSKNFVLFFYTLLKNNRAIITDKTVRDVEKFRPLPLRTVEFQKICSSYFKMAGHTLMDIAEKLYNNGYISYPRTETDSFGKGFNFNEIVNKLKRDEQVGEYASNFMFKYPRSGKNNDQAHSPIYPLKSGNGLKGEERKVYEFIARRFLGCVSENAKGVKTDYVMEIGYDNLSSINVNRNKNSINKETFTSSGLVITERNYLEVYVYDKWEESPVGDFSVNQKVEGNVELTEGTTTAPEYLTESDLIGLMDRNGIGTDATIHEHIQKIQTREYARKENMRFIPTLLGINLIKVYVELDLGVNEPEIRKNLEDGLGRVCVGEIEKDQLVRNEIGLYKRIYRRLEGGVDLFKRMVKSGVDDEKDNKGGSGGGVGKANTRGSKAGDKASNKQRDKRRATEGNSEAVENRINIVKRSNVVKISCNCGKEAKRWVAKKGTRNGEGFYGCCSTPKRCDFFMWEQELKDGQAVTTAERNVGSVGKTSDTIKCDCGYDTVIRKARTENNNGRLFYCCNKSYKKCKFFKWVEDE